MAATSAPTPGPPRAGCPRGTTATSTARLDAAAAAGAEVIRWFVLADGRAGITFDDGGTPERLQPVVLDDMATALDRLGAHGLRMVPVLFDFTWADAARIVNGVSLGGRSPVLRDAVARHALWRVVDTLVAPFGHHPGIALWDLWNEPDWMTAPWRPPSRRLSPRRLRQCLSELALHVRWHATQPLTVGLASARGLPLCRDLSLDVLQVHWYDHLERRAPLSPRGPCLVERRAARARRVPHAWQRPLARRDRRHRPRRRLCRRVAVVAAGRRSQHGSRRDTAVPRRHARRATRVSTFARRSARQTSLTQCRRIETHGRALPSRARIAVRVIAFAVARCAL